MAPHHMPNTRTSWKKLRDELDARPDGNERQKMAAQALEEELDSFVESLAAIRRRRNINQVELASRLGVNQGQVSNLERQQDMLLSSLRKYIEGLGGELHLVAAFPNSEDVTIVVGEDLLASS